MPAGPPTGEPLDGAPPLLAVAHGSRDPRSADTVATLFAQVRQRLPHVPVRVSYLDHQAPDPATAARGLAVRGAGEVVVMPTLLTAAYHSKVDLPRLLERVRADRPWLDLRLAAPLGPHFLLERAVNDRLAEVGVLPDPRTAVVLAGAGSSDPEALRTVESVAAALMAPGHWHSVVAAHASMASPTPREAVGDRRRAGASRVAVARYLLADGVFADRIAHEADLGAADAVSAPLGAHPHVADVIVDRYRQTVSTRRGGRLDVLADGH
ncbi:sirohydrochlorin chelatase [Spiractinospora alimapuensis]|uniref:sirohydrochlorin chelatase n=1 Tax=Spiractinospora alimapuensis TaxID=2820884 RepID=UPI001F473858|nr:sirohydrochlorin chelatase [Spiractinospora alimapuensis]QVQ52432.1 sirohydrochlorin chelatase [Spiractinospora alimapuensis]